jgi:hypothetical protein
MDFLEAARSLAVSHGQGSGQLLQALGSRFPLVRLVELYGEASSHALTAFRESDD